ncbi:MAG: hypothetical protein WBX15_05745 [Thermoanaerobaculia bacterium]
MSAATREGLPHGAATALAIDAAYVPAGELPRLLDMPETLLGIVTFGDDAVRIDGVPHAHVSMPFLAGEPLVEVWRSGEPVRQGREGQIRFAANAHVVFGVATASAEPSRLTASAEKLYRDILRFTEKKGYPHFLRMWNHFPRINSTDVPEGNYQAFCVGRHDGFASAHHDFERELPAASGVGTSAGDLVIYFIASTTPGIHLENPRQVSAYHYPRQYGPRSPSFARATKKRWHHETQLFVSGTASVVGHESLHPGDVRMQTLETLENIRMVFAAATNERIERWPAGALVKSYLRRPEELALVREIVVSEFPPDTRHIFLHGEICRPELLVEIEAILRWK